MFRSAGPSLRFKSAMPPKDVTLQRQPTIVMYADKVCLLMVEKKNLDRTFEDLHQHEFFFVSYCSSNQFRLESSTAKCRTYVIMFFSIHCHVLIFLEPVVLLPPMNSNPGSQQDISEKCFHQPTLIQTQR